MDGQRGDRRQGDRQPGDGVAELAALQRLAACGIVNVAIDWRRARRAGLPVHPPGDGDPVRRWGMPIAAVAAVLLPVVGLPLGLWVHPLSAALLMLAAVGGLFAVRSLRDPHPLPDPATFDRMWQGGFISFAYGPGSRAERFGPGGDWRGWVNALVDGRRALHLFV